MAIDTSGIDFLRPDTNTTISGTTQRPDTGELSFTYFDSGTDTLTFTNTSAVTESIPGEMSVSSDFVSHNVSTQPLDRNTLKQLAAGDVNENSSLALVRAIDVEDEPTKHEEKVLIGRNRPLERGAYTGMLKMSVYKRDESLFISGTGSMLNGAYLNIFSKESVLKDGKFEDLRFEIETVDDLTQTVYSSELEFQISTGPGSFPYSDQSQIVVLPDARIVELSLVSIIDSEFSVHGKVGTLGLNIRIFKQNPES
jgi:hypothetical protein